jgi:predicted Fe-Mo cluster-binding NifX family protein
VSPVFDVASRFLLVEVIGGEASFTEQLAVQRADRVGTIAEAGADVVVCGAISRDLEERLLASGIEVVAEIRGAVVDVIRAFLDGALGQSRFTMPGGHARRRAPRPHSAGEGSAGSSGANRTMSVAGT